MNSQLRKPNRRRAVLVCGGLVLLLFMSPIVSHTQEKTDPPSKPEPPLQEQPQELSIERRAREAGVPLEGRDRPRSRFQLAAQREARKQRMNEAKRNAAQLAELANSLNAELAKANDRVLPIGIVQRAAKIEKLAKQVKNWAKRP